MVGMLVRRLAASETFQLFKILIRFGFSNDDAVDALLRFALLRFASSRSSSVRAAIVCGDSSIESVRVVM